MKDIRVFLYITKNEYKRKGESIKKGLTEYLEDLYKYIDSVSVTFTFRDNSMWDTLDYKPALNTRRNNAKTLEKGSVVFSFIYFDKSAETDSNLNTAYTVCSNIAPLKVLTYRDIDFYNTKEKFIPMFVHGKDAYKDVPPPKSENDEISERESYAITMAPVSD